MGGRVVHTWTCVPSRVRGGDPSARAWAKTRATASVPAARASATCSRGCATASAASASASAASAPAAARSASQRQSRTPAVPTVWMQHSSPSTRVEKHAAHASRTTDRMLHRRTRLGVRLHVSSLTSILTRCIGGSYSRIEEGQARSSLAPREQARQGVRQLCNALALTLATLPPSLRRRLLQQPTTSRRRRPGRRHLPQFRRGLRYWTRPQRRPRPFRRWR